LADDELIRALIDDDPRPRRGHLPEERGDVVRARVRELESNGAQRNVQSLLLVEAAVRLPFFREPRGRSDAHDVSFEHIRERVLAKDYLQRLIPWHIDKVNRDRTGYVRIDSHVQA